MKGDVATKRAEMLKRMRDNAGSEQARSRAKRAAEDVAGEANRARIRAAVTSSRGMSKAGRVVGALGKVLGGASKVLGVADFTLPKESVKKALKDASDVYETKAIKQARVRGSGGSA